MKIILASLLLGVPAVAAAQNSSAPANVVTPAPTPREGTVGPEQLRDFALPGTRQTPPPAAQEAPPPTRTTAPPPAAPRTPSASPPPPGPARSEAARTAQETPVRPAAPALAPAEPAGDQPLPAATIAPPVAEPVVAQGEALPPIVVTQSGAEPQSSLLSAWWPWLLVAMLSGIGLALALRQRRRTVLAGPGGHASAFAGIEPAVSPRAPAPAPPPLPAPAPPPKQEPQPGLPTGMVTTRLRPAPASAPALAPAAVPPAPAGGIVSKRLRAWVELDVAVREILFEGDEVLLRIDLIVANGGTASARDISLEAMATNAGEDQGPTLAAFFERSAGAAVAVVELGPLSDTTLSHELKMPRSAIRAYEAQGRTLFVPVIAINARYRTASGEGRTGAAFLVGRDTPGTEKLSPLLLAAGPKRLLGLGVRRLEEAMRR